MQTRYVRAVREWVRWFYFRAVPLEHVAIVLELELDQVKTELASRAIRPDGEAWPFNQPTPDDARRRKILNWTAIKTRRLAELRYTPAQIADLLCLDVEAVTSFIRRCRRIRSPRADRMKAGGCLRPRTEAEQAAAERARDRARQRRYRRKLATPPPGWTYKDRSAASRTDVDDLARFLGALKDGRLSNVALLELSAGLFFAGPRPAPVPLPEPTVWTGAVDPHFRGSSKLTPGQITEAAELLRAGSSFPELAARYGVSVNTLRTYVDVGPLRRQSWPTEAAVYSHGVVRWDRPLVEDPDAKVWVTCRCGLERLINAVHVLRTDFTAQCHGCFSKSLIGPRILTPDQIAEAADLLRSGISFSKVAERFDCSVVTIRRYVDIGPLRRTSWPTEAQTCSYGVVQWDRPLVQDGKASVWVVCKCSRERLVKAAEVAEKANSFTAQCRACWCKHGSPPPCPPLPVGEIPNPGENPGKTGIMLPWGMR